MRTLLLAALAAIIVLLLAGCGSEIRGITKPEPRIRNANVMRSASAAYLDTNRIEFWVSEFACYRRVGEDRVYLDFQYDRAEASGDGGKAIFVVSSWSHEALAEGQTYFILAEIGAYIYDTRSAKDISGRIAATRARTLGRALNEAEMEKVRQLADLILEAKTQGKMAASPAAADSRYSETPLTEAYDAGLWECFPDGTSRQIL